KRADLLIRHRRRDARRAAWRESRGFQPLAGFGFLDIPRDHAAMRAGAGDARKLDAGVLGDAAGQRRRKDAGVTVALRRLALRDGRFRALLRTRRRTRGFSLILRSPRGGRLEGRDGW